MLIIILLPLILGWFAGYLINYISDTLPVTRRLSHPECPHCHAPYTWKDYFSSSKCPACKKNRSARTLIVQAVITVVSILLWFIPNPRLPYLLGFPLIVFLTMVLVMDLEHRLILHPVSWTGAVLGLLIGTIIHSHGSTLGQGLLNTLIGGAFGFGVMLIFYFLGEAYVRYMSKKRGMSSDEVALGFGDVNLSGILGMLLGWPAIVVGLFFGILAGGVVSLVIILWMLISKKYRAFTAIPYAPFLILGAIFLIYL
jgi:leader peptidase (prepilin peptidase) / N-methyltransferase